MIPLKIYMGCKVLLFSKISYVIIYTPSVRLLSEFFRDKLGLRIEYLDDSWSEIHLDNIVLAIHKDPNAEPKNTGIVFATTGIHRAVDELRAKKVSVSEVTDLGFGYEAFFKDPYGNQYSIYQPKVQ